jgi:hypothetical protein
LQASCRNWKAWDTQADIFGKMAKSVGERRRKCGRNYLRGSRTRFVRKLINSMTNTFRAKPFPLSHFDFKPEMGYPRLSGVGHVDPALAQDILRLREHWQCLNTSRSRGAIYDFLQAAYEIVLCWMAEHQEIQCARRALKLNGLAPPEDPEPFAAVILAGISPGKMDRRQLSKYSRALRFAAACDCHPKGLKRFIKTRWGGINDCAAAYSRRLRRQ